VYVNDALAVANFPAGTFYDHKSDPEGVFPLELNSSNAKGLPKAEPHFIFTSVRGPSIYSRSERGPIKLSSTPPDVKSLIAANDTPYRDAFGPKVLVIRDMQTKEDSQPPAPPMTRLPARFTRPLLRISELPERLSSLASLHQAISEFPLPPARGLPSRVLSRYGPNVSQVSLPLGGKDAKVRDVG
jgi:hypothetical protein